MKLPPHSNAEAHAKLMSWLRQASPKEVMALSKRAGIYNKDGSLNYRYRPRRKR